MPKITVSGPDAAVAVDRLMLLATDARDGEASSLPSAWCGPTVCMADE